MKQRKGVKFVAVMLTVVMLSLVLLQGVGTSAASNISSAVPISLGTTQSGRITEAEQVNYFSFYLPSAGQVKLNVENYLGYGMGYQIYSSNNKRTIYESPINSIRESFNLGLDKGTYYIKFVGNNNPQEDYSYFLGEYDFKITFTSAGVNHTEPNNTIGTSANISLGKTINGHIAKNNEIDYYKFKVSSKGEIKINVETYLELYGSLGIQIYDSKKRVIHEQSCYNKQYFTLNLYAGTYYMKFIGNSSTSDYSEDFGDYNFKVTLKKFTKPGKVKLSSVKNSGYWTLTAKWKKIRDADGYQLIYSTKKSFKGKKSVYVEGNYTNSSVYWLKKKKTYYFKVRAYKKFDERAYYGSYGNVKKVKVRA